jgi:hypothetical protein
VSDPGQNPYARPAATPVAPPPGEPTVSVAAYARVLRVAPAVAGIYAFWIGVVDSVRFGYGLRRFGGIEYVPRVIALSMTRSDGARASFVAACFTLVVVLHRASARNPAVSVRERSPHRVGAAVAAGMLPATLLGLLGGAVGLTVFYSQPFGAIASAFRTVVVALDIVHGLLEAALQVVLAMLFAFWPLRRIGLWRRGLPLKLLVTYFVVLAAGTATSVVGGLADVGTGLP